MLTNRRNFIRGLGAVFAAPAIVRVSALMPVKLWQPPPVAMSFRAATLREDLEYLIYNIMPTETPFLTTWRATDVFHEWQTAGV